MAPTKLLTVFGATGNQGGSVINAMLAHPTLSTEFKLRAITRDTSKPNAKALNAKGVETVKASLDDEESLKAALEGSYAVFGVTNYWEQRSRAVEEKQGHSIADVSKAVGVKHLIWSALPAVSALTDGQLKHVSHFESKAAVADYIEGMKGDMVASHFMPGFYMSNIKSSIRPGPDGVPTLNEPWDANETKIPLLDTAGDSGKFVAGLLAAEPSSVNGMRVHATSEWVTPAQLVETIHKVSGTEVKFNSIPAHVFQTFLPPPIAEELTENMILVRDYSYFGKGEDQKQARSDSILGEQKKTSWAEFVEANGPWKW